MFENFEQILMKFFEVSLFAYSCQINFPNHYVSGKNILFWGGTCPPPKVKTVKNIWGGGHVPHQAPHGPPMFTI